VGGCGEVGEAVARRGGVEVSAVTTQARSRTRSSRHGTTRKPEGSPVPGLPRMCEAALVKGVKVRAL
jgi:hypothetical protein